MKLSEFIESYFDVHVAMHNKATTSEDKRQILGRTILPFLGDKELEKIAKVDIMVFAAKCKKLELSNKTINNHLTVLRNILTVAEEMEVIRSIPRVKMLKCDKPEPTFLSQLQIKDLLEATEDLRWRAAIDLVVNTGLRIGELRALEWNDIGYRDGNPTIRIHQACARHSCIIGTPKGRKSRSIPLSEAAIAAVKSVNRLNKFFMALPLLPEQPVSYGRCSTALRHATKVAGLKGITWHDLRHTFASSLAAEGVSILQIQELLGHVDISTTMKYAHLAPSSLASAIAKLPSTSLK